MHQQSRAPLARPFTLIGEQLPTWLAGALALLGTLGSVGTVWLLGAPSLPRDLRLPRIAVTIGHDNAPPALPAAALEAASVQAVPPQATDTTAPPQAVDEAAPHVCLPLLRLSFAFRSTVPIGSDLTTTPAVMLQEWLGHHPEAKALIEGYTDARGAEEFNMLLSYRRAKAVAAQLVAAGVAPTQLLTLAYGTQQPLQGLPPEAGENRRVTVRIAGMPVCLNAFPSEERPNVTTHHPRM